jgi:uncharacterized protein
MSATLKELMSDRDQIFQTVQTIPFPQRLAFVATCCERFVPDYYAFAHLSKGGDPGLIMGALDGVWSFLKGKSLDEKHIHTLRYSFSSLIDHTEENASVYGLQAFWAIAALDATLQYCLDQQIKSVFDVIELRINALLAYLRDVNYPSKNFLTRDEQLIFDDWIYRAPLLRAELKKQREDLDTLKSCERLDSEFLDSLRANAKTVGIYFMERRLIL